MSTGDWTSQLQRPCLAQLLSQLDLREDIDLDEAEAMAALGLPTAFASTAPSQPQQQQQKRKYMQDSDEVAEGSDNVEQGDAERARKRQTVCQPDDAGGGTRGGGQGKAKSRKQQQQKKQRQRAVSGVQGDDDGNPLNKYYYQRYRLWERYDEGIRMDTEGWYSVTPEKIARHTARYAAAPVVVDAFCGVGGNTVQFALTSFHVIAVDTDAYRLQCAQHNTGVYGVSRFVDFVHGDFFLLAERLRADVVFLSPPWGGPEYQAAPVFPLAALQPRSGAELLRVSLGIAPNVVMFLPRTVDQTELVELACEHQIPLQLELNMLGTRISKPKGVTAYFGPMFAAAVEDTAAGGDEAVGADEAAAVKTDAINGGEGDRSKAASIDGDGVGSKCGDGVDSNGRGGAASSGNEASWDVDNGVESARDGSEDL